LKQGGIEYPELGVVDGVRAAIDFAEVIAAEGGERQAVGD
jgi:hypothetical protein